MATVSANDIERVRAFVNDFYDSNPVQNENLSPQVDAVKKTFDLLEFRARLGKAIWNTTKSTAATSWVPPFVIQSDTSVNVSATSYDLTLGQFTISPAPKNTVKASYFFQRFTDADVTAYLNEGLNFIGGNTAFASIDGAPGELQTGAVMYSAYLAYVELATRAAHLGNSALGQARADLNDVAKKYTELAKERKKDAYEIRDDYYKRAGQRHSPAFGWVRQDGSARSVTPQR